MNADLGPEERVAAAFEWVASLVGLARRLIAAGTDVDLSPIRPAIQELCGVLRVLPAVQAREWISHLLDLQHELAALGHDLAVRRQKDCAGDSKAERADDSMPATHGEGAGTCR